MRRWCWSCRPVAPICRLGSEPSRFRYWLGEYPVLVRLERVSCKTPKLFPFEAQVLPPDSAIAAPPKLQALFFSALFAEGQFCRSWATSDALTV